MIRSDTFSSILSRAAYSILSSKENSGESFSLHAVLFSMFYGTLMELLQVLVPKRSFSFEDIIANTSGAIGFLIMTRFLTGSFSN
ncbi:MAG: VanZ family protein [Nitrospirae bacterium]|nr:VanZ family protein [Nitrospirota bacterium]